MKSNSCTVAAVAGFLFALVALSSHAASHAAEQWGVGEITLQGPSGGNPYLNVSCSATFSQGEQHVTVPGFWDGKQTYRVRFSPPTAGEWRYETKSATPELNGQTGVLKVTPPTGNNHGPVQVFNTYYLHYADGTRYHEFGTTCYAWVHQPEALQQQTLKTLAASPFNKIRFCVFPKAYVYNRNEPEYFAFKKGPDGKFDFNHPDPEFWRHFEQRLLGLQKLGIEADIILWHPYDRWGFSNMGDEADDRYLRYCIARLSAFRNVWWSLANEFDFIKTKQMDDWDRFFSILQKEDPHQRLRGIHNGSVVYDHTKPWVTHASLQKWDIDNTGKYREQYKKPVIFDESGYEGNIKEGWGHLNPRDMASRFWIATFLGAYAGHGETYQEPNDVLWWSKGGVLRGQSPKRIQWLKDIMAEAPPFDELKPVGNYALAKEGAYYLIYCIDGGAKTVQLTGVRPYTVERIDLWNMTVTPAGTASPGQFTLSASKRDQVYRFVPLSTGETGVPEVNTNATKSDKRQ